MLNLLGKSLYELPKAGEPPKLDSPKVCKSHLVWQCPFKLLEGNRDIPMCHKTHLERNKVVYQALVASGENIEFQKEARRQCIEDLRRCVTQCDDKINRSNVRITSINDQRDSEDITEYEKEEYKADAEITIMEIDALVSSGLLDKAIELSCAIEKQNSQRKLESKTDLNSSLSLGLDSPTQACDVCGAIISKLDNDRRLADHFVGRIHLGYDQIRQKLHELTSTSV